MGHEPRAHHPRHLEGRPQVNTHDPNIHIIENASLDDIRVGDYITWTRVWERDGVAVKIIYEGIAHHRGDDDDWWTKGGMYITNGEDEGVTITIHRPINDLPRYDGAVIVPIDEDGVVEAGFYGITYTTRHATYDSRTDTWVGLWRRTTGDTFIARMAPRNIIKHTWKEKDA